MRHTPGKSVDFLTLGFYGSVGLAFFFFKGFLALKKSFLESPL